MDSKEDTTSHYFFVIDTSTPENKVVGGGSWSIYEENPFAKEQESEGRGVYWFPEGSDSRKFAEIIFEKRVAVMLERAQRPHAGKLKFSSDSDPESRFAEDLPFMKNKAMRE